MTSSHEETILDRLLTLQEKLRHQREIMRRSNTPLHEQDAVMESFAQQMGAVINTMPRTGDLTAGAHRFTQALQ